MRPPDSVSGAGRYKLGKGVRRGAGEYALERSTTGSMASDLGAAVELDGRDRSPSSTNGVEGEPMARSLVAKSSDDRCDGPYLAESLPRSRASSSDVRLVEALEVQGFLVDTSEPPSLRTRPVPLRPASAEGEITERPVRGAALRTEGAEGIAGLVMRGLGRGLATGAGAPPRPIEPPLGTLGRLGAWARPALDPLP